ncbi:MAG: hypothetical protein AB7P12_13970 [Alphaproteobacteria bacterium]
MLAPQTSEQTIPAGEEPTSKPEGSAVTLLPPAALTASMVRRGRDPWWGEEQSPKLKPGYDDAAARLARTRAMFESKDEASEDGVLDLGMSAIVTADVDSDTAYAAPEPFVPAQRRSSTFVRDAAIFLTVLMTSCVVTLYLSLQLD